MAANSIFRFHSFQLATACIHCRSLSGGLHTTRRWTFLAVFAAEGCSKKGFCCQRSELATEERP